MTKQVNLAEYMAFIKDHISNVYHIENKRVYDMGSVYIIFASFENVRYIPIAENNQYSKHVLLDIVDRKCFVTLEM